MSLIHNVVGGPGRRAGAAPDPRVRRRRARPGRPPAVPRPRRSLPDRAPEGAGRRPARVRLVRHRVGLGPGRAAPTPPSSTRSASSTTCSTPCAPSTASQASEAVVAGFSQGGALAVALGLQRTDRARPAAVLAMSTYLPDVDGVEYDWAAAKAQPVLVQHGTEDPLIPVDRGRDAGRARSSRTACPIVYGEYPMGAPGRARERAAGAAPGSTPCAPGSSRPSRSPRTRPNRS